MSFVSSVLEKLIVDSHMHNVLQAFYFRSYNYMIKTLQVLSIILKQKNKIKKNSVQHFRTILNPNPNPYILIFISMQLLLIVTFTHCIFNVCFYS